MKRYGFIGTGNMGGALCTALCRTVNPRSVLLTDRDAAKAEALAARLGASAVTQERLAAECDCIFLGVKPQVLPSVLASLRPQLSARETLPLLVSMAAGVPLRQIEEQLALPCPILRIMPNTPAAVGEGMLLLASNAAVTEEQTASFCADMAAAGRCERLPEALIDAASAVSGCGPAFVYLFIEALSDGGVACGLPRAQAMELAAQTVLGAARMVLDSGEHPGVLKDAVCSPGGTTIAGVRALESHSFRAAAMEAVVAAYDKTCALRDGK